MVKAKIYKYLKNYEETDVTADYVINFLKYLIVNNILKEEMIFDNLNTNKKFIKLI